MDGETRCGQCTQWKVNSAMTKNTNTGYNVDKPQKHYATGKKPHTKDHMLYNSIYMKYPEEVNPQRQNTDLVVIKG